MTTIFSDPSYFIPPLVAGAVTLILLVIASVWSRRDFNTWLFCGFLTSMALSNFLVFSMRMSSSANHALLWERALIIPSAAAFVFYYHFTLIYTNTQGQRYALRAAYLFLIIIVALAPTNFIMQEMHVTEYGFAPIVGPVSYIAFAAGPLLVLGAAYNLLRHYRVSTSTEARKRLIILAIAAILPIIGMLWDGFTTLPPLSVWSNLLFTILCTIAILKYRLLDIRIFVRKSLVYLLTSFVAAIPYVSILVLVNQFLKPKTEIWWIHTVLILFLAVILQPLYSWAQNLVDKAFYRDRYSYLKALERFGRETQSIVNLEELGARLVRLVAGALWTPNVGLLVTSEDNSGFGVVSCTPLEKRPPGIVLRNDNPIVKRLELHGKIISSEEVSFTSQLQSFSHREQDPLEWMEAQLYVPIRTGYGQLFGLLVLGKRLSHQAYSDEDKQLLSTLAAQMATTLENARLYDAEKSMRMELEKLNEQKTEFLHSVAHELKTPLTAIISSSELLSEESSTRHSLGKRLVSNIRTSAESMNRRLTELLNLAQMQIGEQRIEPRPLEINRAITEIASLLEVLFEKKKQTLTLKMPDLLPEVNVDRTGLEQVVFNLLSNANKFSSGGSHIILRVREVDRKIIVEVEDSAPAVTEEEKEKIFNPYYRGEDSARRKRLPGIGLGLAISKKLVELHGGEIWVESKPGKGNIFAFSVPVLDRRTNGVG